MRDYDEYADYNDQDIRLYTPVLQRVIILGAVIIAVPVMMWTITTFVRSYVARPKLPALEHVASANMPEHIPAISPPPPNLSRSAADQSAPPRSDGASAADPPNSAAEIKKGLPNPAAPGDTGSSAAAANSPSGTPSLQLPPLQAPSPAIAPSAASTTGDTSTGNAGAAAIQPTPRRRPRSTDSPASTGAVSSSDRGIAWPNPNATNPPEFGAQGLPPPSANVPPARAATAEFLPTDEPIRGPIPLPRQRPAIFAMAGSALVPLPRARPGDAPAEAATTSVVDPPYWPLMDNVR